MKLKKYAIIFTSIFVAAGAMACSTAPANTATPVSVAAPEEKQTKMEDAGIVNNIAYNIYYVEEAAKYQKNILAAKGYYIDYLEEDNSPTFCMISSGTKNNNNKYPVVQNIEIDHLNNVTITIYEEKVSSKEPVYDMVEVVLHETIYSGSIKVVDTDGNELTRLD